MKKCPVCKGTRQDPAYSEIPVKCPNCNGSGTVNNPIDKEETQEIIKEYLKEKLEVIVRRDGYNETLLVVDLILDGEVIDTDNVSMQY